MLRWGIPEYRLPKKMLDHEIELIRRKGVKFVYNCRIGKDITLEELRKENDAVFISAGAHVSRKLGVEGEDKPGVDLRRRIPAAGRPPARQTPCRQAGPRHRRRQRGRGRGPDRPPPRRQAGRDGLPWRQRDEMPAYPEEIEATLAEGITIRNGWGPHRILGNGTVTGIELKRCTRVFDENGRFSPAYDENNLTTVEADQIIMAIGQAVSPDLLQHFGVETERGCFKADPVTLETSVEGIFAGGDNATRARRR